MSAGLDGIPTPALVLDRRRLRENAATMRSRMERHGVALRPHLKTAKSAQVARVLTDGCEGGITVSTLQEAAYFVEHGFRDITYAVSILPERVDRVAALQREGARVRLITDDPGVARALGERAAALDARLDVLVEVDSGQGRTGVPPTGPELLEVAEALRASPRIRVAGVLTHAGHAYGCDGPDGVRAVAEEERAGIVGAARRLQDAGIECPVVSAGSTPTAIHAARLDGVTEMRPGNYAFFDLFQEGIGSCSRDAIALTVLAAVLAPARHGRIVVDAGSLALSSDRGANRFGEVGYGVVLDVAGQPLGLRVREVNQEHGILEVDGPVPSLRPGTRVRILPNHACLTAAMFDRYHVVEGEPEIIEEWERTNRW
ncbi:MAG: alanine racemase [Acidobacteriota bacterium]|jgi:D-serine deaminase-like pyridoxal phosphate-dependent protein